MPTVMITGDNHGLGFEFAKQYAADGWRVFAACRHPTSADSLRLLAERSKGLVKDVTMDVTDLRSVTQAAVRVGDGAIDVLINSAGIAGKPDQKAGKVDYESWAAVFNVNAMGPLRVTETFIGHLARGERKLAVTITSGRQHVRRLDCLSQFEGGGKHGGREAIPGRDRLIAIMEGGTVLTINGKTGWREFDIGRGSQPSTCRIPKAALAAGIRGDLTEGDRRGVCAGTSATPAPK